MKNIVLLLLYVSFLNTYFFSQNNYTVSGSQILKNNVEWEFVGTNNMAAFSIPYNYNTQQSFGMDIVRECIDLKLTSNETLESIISTARSKGFVIILAGFWYDNDAFIGGTTPYPECQLLGKNPQEDSRWEAVMSRWEEIANLPFIKNKTDVWINPWNEPYNWQGLNGYTNNMWEEDAKKMIDIIRNTGANNIILIEGSHTGQGYEVIIERGANVKTNRSNIIFDVHAYNYRWNVEESIIRSRFKAIKNSGNAFIIGEFSNNGDEVWQTIMNVCRTEKISLLAWLWGQYKEPFSSNFEEYCMATRNTLSINHQNILPENISVFPNPSKNIFFIDGNFKQNTIFEIYNTSGKLVLKKEIVNILHPSISLSILEKGVYFLKIKHDKDVKNLKLVKN